MLLKEFDGRLAASTLARSVDKVPPAARLVALECTKDAEDTVDVVDDEDDGDFGADLELSRGTARRSLSGDSCFVSSESSFWASVVLDDTEA